jgi:acetate kinase
VSTATVLVVNAGSSSLKLRLLGPDDDLLAGRDLEAAERWEDGLEDFVAGPPEPDAIGHRVVHGGAEFTAPVRVDAEVEERLERLEDLAPLHNPPAVRAIRTLHRLRPKTPAVACFDTAFHHTLPPAAATYALPPSWAERWPLRRFGFHGLSHTYTARRTAELLHRPQSELRLVTAHLGAGASLAAVAGGRSVDTTMGFTPLDGLVMATRSGSVDPGLLLWVQRHGDIDPVEAERALDSEAGLLGLSGRSTDTRELLAAAEAGDERAALALEVYLHRLRASIAAMVAAMGGLDAMAFTGGVGEGSPEIRGRACDGLGFLGLALDAERNEIPETADRDLSSPGAGAATLLIHAREDLEIATQVRTLLDREGRRPAGSGP